MYYLMILLYLHIIKSYNITFSKVQLMKTKSLTKTLRLGILSTFISLLTITLTFGQANSSQTYKIASIVIDAGHGGKDHGCQGIYSEEKHIVLDIALDFGDQLKRKYPNLNVVYTRTTDEFIELNERAKIANHCSADLFVSIHCNFFDVKEEIHGAETYVMGLHTADENLEVAKRENSAIIFEDNYQQNYEGYDPNSPLGHILLSMFQNVHLEQSIQIASFIQQDLKKIAHRHDRGVKQAGFLVLRKTAMPSVLVETGYLSNLSEEEFLHSEEGKKHIADALVQAFSKYKEKIEAQAAEEQQSFIANNEIIELEESNIPQETQAILVSEQVEMPDLEHNHDHHNHDHEKADSPKIYVQVAASDTELKTDGDKWKALSDIWIKEENQMFKYLSFPNQSLSQAKKDLMHVRSRGFKDAFLVAYDGETKISISSFK